MNASPPDSSSDTPALDAFRREQRRLRWLERLLLVVGLVFVGWVVWAVMIAERRDIFYGLPSIFGTVTGLSRYFVYRVRALPAAVLDLRHPDATVRDRAWTLIDAHRAEILGATSLPSTIHEPPLVELSREALVERLTRAGTTDWRRVLRVWLYVWVPLAVTVFLLTLLYTPDPTPVDW